MTAWRMSFRLGTGGKNMWPFCLQNRVAAITYYPLGQTDLSRYSKHEPADLWHQLSGSQHYSLSRVAYDMKKGDEVYVRYEGRLVGKGTVISPYKYDHEYRIIDNNGEPWSHQVPVSWDNDFPQFTVWEIPKNDLAQIKILSQVAIKGIVEKEAIEGELLKKEMQFRSRNRSLIAAKKANSDYRCEICGFIFTDDYGQRGDRFIIAHHNEPIGKGKAPRKTTLQDISLLCANCHSMIHKTNPPVSINSLRILWNRHSE